MSGMPRSIEQAERGQTSLRSSAAPTKPDPSRSLSAPVSLPKSGPAGFPSFYREYGPVGDYAVKSGVSRIAAANMVGYRLTGSSCAASSDKLSPGSGVSAEDGSSCRNNASAQSIGANGVVSWSSNTASCAMVG